MVPETIPPRAQVWNSMVVCSICSRASSIYFSLALSRCNARLRLWIFKQAEILLFLTSPINLELQWSYSHLACLLFLVLLIKHCFLWLFNDLVFFFFFKFQVNVKLRLPVVLNKFLQPILVSAEEFFPQWKSLSGPPLKLQEVVSVHLNLWSSLLPISIITFLSWFLIQHVSSLTLNMHKCIQELEETDLDTRL